MARLPANGRPKALTSPARYSSNLELLEIVMPADFQTIDD